MEIGSIYEIDPGTVQDDRTGNASGLRLREVEKYNKKHVSYTASGREAIAWALESMEKIFPGIVKECLIPAYMCDTVFFPFEHAGWKLHFYHIGKNLEAEQEELRRLIEHIRPGLLFIHPYYGVDTWKPIRSLLKEWRSQGIRVMEDVTQSYYLEEAGTEADYVIGSLRKWYPVPDGGFVVSDYPLPDKELPVSREFTEKRLEFLTQKWDYLYGDKKEEEKKALKKDYLDKNRRMEQWLDEFSGVNAISGISQKILSQENEEACKKIRNENYRYLFEVLKSAESVAPVFGIMKEDAAPLYFPVYAKEREGLQEFLCEKDVYAPVLWPIGGENEEYLSEDERYIFGHMLALPIDQRYGKAAMKQIAEAVRAYERFAYGKGTKRNDRNTGGCQ